MMPAISLKTLNLLWNIFLATSLFVLFYFLLIFILFPYIPKGLVGFIALYGAILSSSFLSKYLTSSDTTISVDQGVMTIETYQEFSNRSKTRSWLLQDIAGFEIHKSQLFQALILYEKEKAPQTIVFYGDSRQKEEIRAFMNSYAPQITKKQKLSPASWQRAFMAALCSLTILYGGIICGYLLIQWLSYALTHSLLSTKVLYWLALPIPFLLYFNRRHNRRSFRIVGRNLTWIICLVLTFLGCALLPKLILPLVQQKALVNNLNESLNYENLKFFSAKSLYVDTTNLGYKADITTGRRSTYHAVSHTFAVPAYVPKSGKIHHQVWLAKQYRQRIQKNLSQSTKEERRVEWMNEAASHFKKLIIQQAGFYEVRYSALNKSFADEAFFKAAASTHHIEGPVIVLEPHTESFEAYRMTAQRELLIGAFILILVVFFNAAIVPIYR